jgi:hypothetical protein
MSKLMLFHSLSEHEIVKEISLTTIFFHVVAIVAIWISIFLLELILNLLGILPTIPTLLLPEYISTTFVLSILLKISFIFIYLRKILYNKYLKGKFPLKILIRSKYCYIKKLNINMFAFECQLPLIDQIKNLELLEEWDPFTGILNWDSGLLTIIFYQNIIETNFSNQYEQIVLFLERSFTEIKVIPPYKLKELIIENYTQKNPENKNIFGKELITSPKQFSEIIRSIDENRKFVEENQINEAIDLLVNVSHIFYWQFNSGFLKKIKKDIVRDNNSNSVFLAQINYKLNELSKEDSIINTKSEIRIPLLGFPPIKRFNIDQSNSSVQLLLYILNKWMFKKISNKAVEISSPIPKKDESSEKQKKIPGTSVVSRKAIEKKAELAHKEEKKPLNVKIKKKNPLKGTTTNLETFINEKNHKKAHNNNENQQLNFIAALDLVDSLHSNNKEVLNSNTKNMNQINDVSKPTTPKMDSQNVTFFFTDFCKKFCSKYSQTRNLNRNPPVECLNSFKKSKSTLNLIIDELDPDSGNQEYLEKLSRILKNQDFDHDMIPCLFTQLSFKPLGKYLREGDLINQIFKEIFI